MGDGRTWCKAQGAEGIAQSVKGEESRSLARYARARRGAENEKTLLRLVIRNVRCLPSGTAITEQDLDRIISVVRGCHK
jgi:hypothetical protein